SGAAARSSDQLPCCFELRFAPCKLAVQLAAAYLGEDLPDARRFAQPELRDIGPVDLELDRLEAAEEVVELRLGGERERTERRIRGARLGERDDVGRRGCVVPELLGDARAVLDRGGDQLTVAAADLERVEPRSDLLVREPAAQRLEPQAPGGH